MEKKNRLAKRIIFALTALSLIIFPFLQASPVKADVPAGDSEYYIPGFSQALRDILFDIDNDPAIGNTLHNVITISVGGDNTTIYYDHWENGYGTGTTGYDEMYAAAKGDILTFESPAIPSNPRNSSQTDCPGSIFPSGGTPGGQSNYCYDGRDRIYVAGGAVSVAQAFWPTASGTVYSNAWEIYPVKPYQTSYTIPVGEDLFPAFADFERVYVIAQATTNGTTIQINDPRTVGVDLIVPLNRGEVTGLSHIGKGTTVTANFPVQVQFIVGAPNANISSESRSYTAVPSTLWSSTYYDPVPGFATPIDTDLYIYNPTAAPLRIDFQDTTGSGFFNIPAYGTTRYSAASPNGAGRYVPQNSGVVLRAHDGSTKFWAIGSQDTESANYNAGFTLIPDTALTSEYFVSWAPGYDIYTCGAPPCTNTSRVFITPTVNNTTVYVDYGPADGTVDATYTLNRLQVQALEDPDRDNTGMHIWSTYPFAIVWAQNAGVTLGTPAIDAGYTVLPFNREWMDTVVSLDKTANPGSILPLVNQTSVFTLTIESYTNGLSGATVLDVLPAGWAYVPGSTTITLPAGAGTITGAAADPIIAGQNLTWNDFSAADPPDPDPLNMPPDETLTIVYTARTTAIPPAASLNTATVTGTYGGTTYTGADTAEVYANQPDLTVVKSNNTDNYAAVGTPFTWSLLVANGGSSGSAVFTPGQAILRDTLPITVPATTYGAVTVTPGAVPPLGPGTIGCSITGNVLTCSASGGNVTLAINSSFTVSFPVTPGVTGALVNPVAPATNCMVDPDNVNIESNEANNNCANTVTVAQPDLTVTKTNNSGNRGGLNIPYTWTLLASNGAAAGPAVFADTQTILRDNLPANATYDSVTVVNGGTPPGGTGTMNCAIAANVLNCTAVGGTVTLPTAGSFTVSFTATPTSGATVVNPTGGVCQVDPLTVIGESNEANNACANTVTITQPDLTVAKSHTPAGARGVGVPFTWSLLVSNGAAAGPAMFTAGQTILRDFLPANATYGTITTTYGATPPSGTGSIDCTIAANTLNCTANGGTVILPTSGSFTVAIATTATSTPSVINPTGGVCQVDPLTVITESNEGNNTCAETIVVNATQPDFTIAKSNSFGVTPASIVLGDSFVWSVQVANGASSAPGTFAAGQTILTDNLPAGPTYGAPSVTPGATPPTGLANINCQIAANTLSCTASSGSVTLPAGGSFVASFSVLPIATGSFVNPTGGICRVDPLTVIGESNEANNNCTANTVNVTAQPNLSAAKANNVGGTYVLGVTPGYFTWTVTVANAAGTGTASFAAGQTILSDDLPAGPAYSNVVYAAGGTAPTGTIVCSIAANTLTCSATNAVTLAANASFTVTFRAAPNTSGVLANPTGGICRVDPADVISESNEANDCANSVTVNAPDLTVTKTNNTGGNGVVGTPFNWVLTATNGGTSPAAFLTTQVILRDPLPAGATYGVPVAGGFSNITNSGNINCTIAASILTCTANGATVTIGTAGSFTVTIPVSPTAAGTLTNTGTVDPNGNIAEGNETNNTGTDTVTVAASADLAITKTDGVATYTPGGTTTYTIVASNAGPSGVTGATVTDTFPAEITGASWTCVAAGGATCTASGSGNISDTINIPVGGTATYTVVANLSASATVNLVNTATVAVPVGTTDPTPGNNSATDTDTAAPSADLAITKTDGVATYTPGGSTTYTIVVSNAGPSNVTGATVADTFPAAITSHNWTCVAASGATCAASGSGDINDTIDIPVGGTATYTVVASISAGATGDLVNTATVASGVSDPTPGNNSATDTDTAAPSADLAITKTDGVATYTPGGTTTYTIVVSNAGPSNVISATVLDDLTNAQIVSATWTCTPSGSGACTASGANDINDTVNIPAGESLTYTVTVNISGGSTGNFVNTATVNPPGGVSDPTPGNNSATDTDTQSSSADLAITKTDGVATYTPGGSTTYTIVVSNAGPSNVTGATVADTFPAAITSHNWTCIAAGGATCAASGSGDINDTIDIPVGGTATYTVVATISAGATGNLINTATVTSGVSDPTPGNNSATDTDTQSSSADLSITKTDGVATYTPGGSTTYTIVVSNAGPSNVTGATVADTFPAAITSHNWTCVAAGGATCAASGSGDISDTIDLPAGGTATYTVVASISAGATGNLINTASVTSGVSDPTPGNNSATDTDTQSSSADLAITKTDGVATYTPGGSTTYTIVVSNAGPSNVTGATVADTFPAAITSHNWTCVAAGGATCAASGSGDINDTIDLPVGGTATYTVVASISAGATGNLINTATVTSGVSDPTPGNNSATDTDTQSSSADLAITKTDGVATYTPGGSTTYTIVVSNAGPSNVTGATVADTFPAAITSHNWTCVAAGGATCAASGSGDINDTIDIPVGGTATYTVVASISAGASGDLVNTATVTSGVSDPTPGNNSATDTDTATPSADLSITKTDGVATYTPGGSTTYTIVVSNAGPSNVTGATVADTVSTCAASGSGDINDTIDIPVGGTATYTVVASISAGATGNLINTATVSSGISDPTPGNNSATDTDTQSSSADLAITKTDGVATYTPGGSTTYTVVVTNDGPSDAIGATVADTFPAALTSHNWTCVAAGGATCAASGSGDINDTIDIPVGGTATYTVTASISAAASGNLVNTASVTSGVSDPTPGNNSATDSDTEGGSADLAITKTDGVATYTPGGSTTYTIVVSNSGPSNVTGATVTDTFPSEITSASWTCVAAGGATCTASGSGNISDTINIPVGGTATYTVVANLSASATVDLVNTATVAVPVGTTDPTPGNNSATDTDTAAPSADLSVTKTDGTGTYTPGGSTTYTIVVSNAGPSTVTGATVADTFPAALTSHNWTCVAAGGATCAASGSGDISDTIDLPAGGTATYTVVASISAGATGNLINTASVTSGVSDPTPGNNSATDTDTQSSSADLAITKTDGVATYTPGGSTTYTIVVSNAGPSNVISATVLDDLTNAQIVSATWTCTPSGSGACTASGANDINDTVNIPAGESLTYTVTVNISGGSTGNFVNTATVNPPGGVSDPTPGNNSATDTDTQSSSADLAITKTDGVATYTPGGSTTYTIVVSNAGPSNVTGATVADTFPAAITSPTWTCVAAGGATCAASGSGDINDTIDIPVGGTATYTVVATISAGATGNLINTATVTSGVSDPTPGNNSATDTDTASLSADLAITKTDGVATYTPGGSTTYTIVVSNAGPSNVTGATVADTFPAAITSHTWTCVAAGGATCSASGSGDINDTIDIPVGGTATYTVAASISAGATGDLVNTASVTSGVSDPTPGNNSATDTDTQSSSADLSITKTDGVATYTPGGSTTYTIVVSNAGPSNVTGATVADSFPAAITSHNWTCVAAGGATCAASGSGDINDTIDIPVGGTATYTVVASISAGASGDLVNTATVTSGVSDPTPGNNSATDTDTATPSADLSITKTDGVATYTPGGSTTYTIVVSNAGPSNVTGATVADTFPAAITSHNWTCVAAGGATCAASGSGDISDTIDIPVGGTATYTVVATISAGATGNLINTATVTSGVSDPTPGNNSATDTDTQSSSADLAITKTDGVATYTPGVSTTYTIVVSNAGPSNVTGATVADTFPAAISASWTCVASGAASCTASGSGNISDTVDIPTGETLTYTVNAGIDPAASGNLVNTATVNPPGGTTDPTPGNNSATDTDTATPAADLVITKDDGIATYTPGGTTTYTVVVTNDGPSDAIGATVADTFPAAITSHNWTCVAAGGATCSASGSGDITDSVNIPAYSGSLTYTITASISSAATGNLVNTALVSSPVGFVDPTPGNNSATDTDTQSSSADLAITKTDGVATYTPGGSTTYTIVVSNAGPSNVTGATVADTFPAAITSHNWTCVAAGGATCAASGSGDINDTIDIPVGGTATYTVVASISAGASGDLVNTASVTSGVSDPTPGNNSATDTDTATPSADLSITKTDGVATYTPGGSTTYTIVVSNAGPSNVTGATVTDTFPAALTSHNWTCVAAGGATCAASGSGDISDTIDIPVGGTATYTVVATISAGATGNLINTATVTSGVSDPTPGNNSATDTDTQSSSADLSITKTDGVATYTPGVSTTYTIVVSNAGPSNVTGATVADTFPVAITSHNWTCVAAGGATCSASGSGDINDTIDIPVGGTATYTVVASISAGASGDLVNTASVTSGVSDPTPGNNSATDTDTATPSADLSVTKTDGVATYTPGGSTTYTIVVNNAGPSNVTGATVADTFPAAITSHNWTCVAAGGATCAASGSGDINDTIDIPVGGTATYTVVASISAGASGDLVNTASVTSGVSDPTPGNNSATDTDTQSSSADLAITKTDGVATYTPGGSTTYTIVVSNAGPSNVTGATVADTFPAAITSHNWTCVAAGGATCAASGSGDINDTIDIPVGGTATYTVVATISAGASGDLVNTASVTSGVSDPTPGNNSATDTDTATPSADLSITKTDGVATYTPGGSTTYTIVVSNAGPSNVTGATVADTFPAAISASWTCVASGAASCTASGSGNISDTVDIPIGGTATYTVVASISAGATGDLVNTATVTSGVSDPTPGNNSATDTDTQSSSADLSITKTDGVATYTPGGTITYTIVVSNAGPGNVISAAVLDDLTNAQIVSATWTCTPSGSGACTASGANDINDTVNIPAGESLTYTVTVNISGGSTGNFVNTATVNPPGGVSDPTPGNNSATDTDTQSSSADLAITKTDGVATYTPGGSTTYTIVVSNAGPSNVTGATVADTFPAAITSHTWTCVAAGGATCSASGSGDINDTIDIPVGGTATYTVAASISAGATGDLVNTASVTSGVSDPTPGNNSATDTDTESGSADLAITKTDGVATYTPGGSTTYTIVVSNAGPSNVTGATVADTFPVAITSHNWTCVAAGGATCAASGSGDINDTIDIPVGGTATYNVVAGISAGATGDLVNTATVTSGVTDPTPGNNSATDTDTQSSSADLSITKTDGVATYTPGGSTTYTIVVNNAGPSNVTGATVADTFPAAITSHNWTCVAAGGATCAASGSGDINDTIDIPVGGTATYTVVASISAGASGDLVNTTTVTSGVSDPTPGNNSATDTDTQSSSADLAITKDDGVATYTPGGTITYTIVVSNAGPGNVISAAVLDDLTNAQIVSATWTCTPSGSGACTASGANDINDTVNIPAGESLTYTVTVNIAASSTGNLVNTATVNPPGGTTDPTPGNNSATDTDASVPGTINGVVWNDADASATRDGGEIGIGGVTITLLNDVGTAIATTLTASDGSYAFLSVLPGDYTVVETDLSGYISTTSNSVAVSVPTGGSAMADFGDYQLTGPVPATINGTVYNDLNGNGVRDAGEPGLVGVTVDLLDSGYNLIATTTTSATGTYAFLGLTPGTYTVRETDPATFISTTSNLVSVTLGSGATATVDFGDQTSGGATIADPAVTKFGDPASARVGDLVTFTITVTNTGNASATNVVVTDTKPGFLDILTVTISPNPGLTVAYAANGFSINFGTVDPGDFYTITVVTRVNSLGIPPGGANNASLTTTSPTDRLFNNAGAANLVISISPGTLPGTGFAPNVRTVLPPQPESLVYADLGELWLEIPRLGKRLPIVGVPNQRAGWDVTWLGNEAGWLNGTAFPTWAGNSVLTGHVYLPDGKPGPFVNLNTLAWGDTVVVHLSGEKYTFQVRQTGQVLPNDLSILKHEDQAWLTLLTCRGFDETTNSYRYRVYARAILVRVEADAATP